jgi:hypothetical protein
LPHLYEILGSRLANASFGFGQKSTSNCITKPLLEG